MESKKLRPSFHLNVRLAQDELGILFATSFPSESKKSLHDWFYSAVAKRLEVKTRDILDIRCETFSLDSDDKIASLAKNANVIVYTMPLSESGLEAMDKHLKFIYKIIRYKSIDMDLLGRVGKKDADKLVWLLPAILKQIGSCEFSASSRQEFNKVLGKFEYLRLVTSWLIERLSVDKEASQIAAEPHQATAQAFLALARRQGPMENIKIDNLNIWDPCFAKKRGACHVIQKMEVIKVFTSQAKPCLIKATYAPNAEDTSKATEGLFILKRGDDLRVDMMVQTMFFVFNRIWANSSMPHTPFCFQFKVIPMALDYGVVECMPACTTLQEYDWNQWKTLDDSQKWKFLCSAAGGYTAGWILGIRDRHKENMMVKDGHIFVQIDFGHMFDRKTKFFDAPRFAIPATMRSSLSPEEWTAFKDLCADGFKYLRRFSTFVVDLTTTLFDGIGLVNMDEARQWMMSRSALMPEMSEEDACDRIRDLVESGATSGWKYVKNVGHVIAHAMK